MCVREFVCGSGSELDLGERPSTLLAAAFSEIFTRILRSALQTKYTSHLSFPTLIPSFHSHFARLLARRRLGTTLRSSPFSPSSSPAFACAVKNERRTNINFSYTIHIFFSPTKINHRKKELDERAEEETGKGELKLKLRRILFSPSTSSLLPRLDPISLLLFRLCRESRASRELNFHASRILKRIPFSFFSCSFVLLFFLYLAPTNYTRARWREKKIYKKILYSVLRLSFLNLLHSSYPFHTRLCFVCIEKVARAPRTLRYPAKKKPTVVRVFFQFSFSSLCFTPFLSTGYGGPSTFTIVDHIYTAKQQNKNSFSIPPTLRTAKKAGKQKTNKRATLFY